MTTLNLSQPPFNTSLMGVLRGVFDYYDIAVSNATLYGASGHAFVMNIHEALCPSGPYCWNYDEFIRLLSNLGVRMQDLGFFSTQSSPRDRSVLEATLKERLDRGEPCSSANMDNQIIYGYDASGFQLTQPWGPECGVTPARLSFGSWAEFGEEVHANFFVFSKIEPAGDDKIIADSLRFAVDLHRNPTRHTEKQYAVGAGAYDNWISAIQNGHGATHGNWWNGTVWSECHQRASDYMREIATKRTALASVMTKLADDYQAIAKDLLLVSEKDRDADDKIELLKQAQGRETGCVGVIGEILGSWG